MTTITVTPDGTWQLVSPPSGGDHQPPDWAVSMAAQLARIEEAIMTQSAQLQAVAGMLAAFEADVETAFDKLGQLAASPDDSTSLSPEAVGVLEQIKAGVAAARAALNIPEAPPATDTPIADATAEALRSGSAGDAAEPASSVGDGTPAPAGSEPDAAELSTDGSLDSAPADETVTEQ